LVGGLTTFDISREDGRKKSVPEAPTKDFVREHRRVLKIQYTLRIEEAFGKKTGNIILGLLYASFSGSTLNREPLQYPVINMRHPFVTIGQSICAGIPRAAHRV
jgi:hypothetical protein